MPVFVSKEAFLEERWLETGVALLAQGGPLDFERNYLFPLPSVDWEGTTGGRATYKDACWMSRALLERLPQKTGEVLLPAASAFWTEHGDRSGCTSWLAALGVNKDTWDFLGR